MHRTQQTHLFWETDFECLPMPCFRVAPETHSFATDLLACPSYHNQNKAQNQKQKQRNFKTDLPWLSVSAIVFFSNFSLIFYLTHPPHAQNYIPHVAYFAIIIFITTHTLQDNKKGNIYKYWLSVYTSTSVWSARSSGTMSCGEGEKVSYFTRRKSCHLVFCLGISYLVYCLFCSFIPMFDELYSFYFSMLYFFSPCVVFFLYIFGSFNFYNRKLWYI